MLTIKKRILLLGGITMVAVLVALVFFLTVQLRAFSSQQALTKHLCESRNMVDVIAALQRERGETTGYLVEHTEMLRTQVQAQRERTDATLSGLSWPDASEPECFRRLVDFRSSVDANTVFGFEAFTFYTHCIESALNELYFLRSSSNGLELSKSFSAYASLLYAMEHLGQLRAIIYMLMYTDADDDPVDFDFQRFVLATEVQYQDAVINFRRNVPEVAREAFERHFSHEYIQEVFELARQVAMKSPSSLPVSPALWFENSTQAVELVRSTAERMNELLVAKVEAAIAKISKRIAFLSIFFAVVLLVILILTWTTIRAVLLRFGKLLVGIERISHTDDFSLRISSRGKDELDAIAVEFNKMMDSIERLIREKAQAARRDPLTGIGNRLVFDEIMDRELTLAQRHGRIFSLILFDIDKFKSVNDAYGHDLGDVVLREMAKAVAASIRKTDVLARWGGEEFVVLLPECDLDTAMGVAEKLRRAVEGHDFPVVGQVSASFGVAMFTPGDTGDTLLKRADQGLLLAKQRGRNQVARA